MDYKGDNAYRVIQPQSLNSEMLISLAVLYEPLIEKTAFSLYHLLAAEANMRNQNMKLSRLCKLLDISIQELTAAIKTLEQFKLLRTYHNEKTDSCRFDIQIPLGPRKFMEHDVFGRLYVKKVGKEQYDLSSQIHSFENIKEDADLEVTSNFDFGFFNDKWSMDDEYSYNELNRSRFSKVIPTFDLARFKRETSYVLMPPSLRSEENFEIIAQMATVFNIDVETMRVLVTDSINIDNNTFDTELLRRKCIETKKQARSSSSFSYEMQPVEFLRYLQKGVAVSSSDKKSLEYLQLDLNLPVEVINYLVEYVYNHNNGVLGKNYLEKIATHWAANGIVTLDQAKKQLEIRATKGRRKARDFINIHKTESEAQDYEAVMSQLFNKEDQ